MKKKLKLRLKNKSQSAFIRVQLSTAWNFGSDHSSHVYTIFKLLNSWFKRRKNFLVYLGARQLFALSSAGPGIEQREQPSGSRSRPQQHFDLQRAQQHLHLHSSLFLDPPKSLGAGNRRSQQHPVRWNVPENEKPNQRESKRRKPDGETGCCSKVIFLCMNENVKKWSAMVLKPFFSKSWTSSNSKKIWLQPFPFGNTAVEIQLKARHWKFFLSFVIFLKFRTFITVISCVGLTYYYYAVKFKRSNYFYWTS